MLLLLDYLREAWTVNAQLQLQINKLPNFTKCSLPNCKSWMYVTAAAGTSSVQLQKLLPPPNALSPSPHGPRSSPTFSQNTVLLSLIPLHSQWMKKATRFSLCLFSNCLKLPSFDLSPPAYRCSCAPATPTREMPSQEQGWSVTLPSGPSLQETDHVLGITFLLLQGLHICHGPVSTPS